MENKNKFCVCERRKERDGGGLSNGMHVFSNVTLNAWILESETDYCFFMLPVFKILPLGSEKVAVTGMFTSIAGL